jgi:antiviral helicase SKI2
VPGTVKHLAAEFDRLRPNLAHHFPFELDTFQKEAIVHLEMVRLDMDMHDQ